MQKKLIALAVAGLASTAAFAQSNVQVYGIADVGVLSVDVGGVGEQTTKVDSGNLSGSRLGFRGTEDLGNGLKAVFNLEYGLNIADNGTNGAKGGVGNARQEMVGLAGNFGTVAAGYLQTTGYDWGVKFGGALAGSKLSALQNLNSTTLIGATAVGARANNALAYISPNLNGFKAAVNYTGALDADETLGKKDQLSAVMVSGTYENGPLAVGVVYAKADIAEGHALGGGAGTGTASIADIALGASYDFGVAKVTGSYQTSNPDGASNTSTVWSLGASMPVGSGAIHAQYANLDEYNGVANSGADAWSIAYTHALSARTTAYVGYSTVINENGGQSNVANNSGWTLAGGGYGATSTALGENSSVFAAGVRHSF